MGGQHQSSFAQQEAGSLLNSQLSGYYVNGQNFHIHLTQTPVVIKSKAEGLMGSSMSANGASG
jgi:hypothetical protein